MNANDRSLLLFKAKMADFCNRPYDMVEPLKTLIENFTDLTVDELNTLSTPYKLEVDIRRVSRRTILDIEFLPNLNSRERCFAKQYREQIEQELYSICGEIIYLLETYVIPKTDMPEIQVLAFKLKGDFNRYMAENASGRIKKNFANVARKAYHQGLEISTIQLSPAHPYHLTVALGTAILYHDILGNKTDALNLAKDIYENALIHLDSLDEETCEESNRLLHYFDNNIQKWAMEALNRLTLNVQRRQRRRNRKGYWRYY